MHEMYVPYQGSMMKPHQAILYLDKGSKDTDKHPFICVAFLLDEKYAYVFHCTSEPQLEFHKNEAKDFVYYIPDLDSKELVYSEYNNRKPSYIDCSHFNIVSFQELLDTDRMYGRASNECIQKILAHNLFLWDFGAAFGENLIDSSPIFHKNKPYLLEKYSFINSYQERNLMYCVAYQMMGKSFAQDLDEVLKDIRKSPMYQELVETTRDEISRDGFITYRSSCVNELNSIFQTSKKTDQKKLVLYEGENDDIVWYPLEKFDPVFHNSNRYYRIGRGTSFDERFYSRVPYVVDLGNLHVSNREDFIKENAGLITHIEHYTNSTMLKNDLLSKTLYLFDHEEAAVHCDYEPRDDEPPAFLNNPVYWFNYITCSVNQFFSDTNVVHDVRDILRGSYAYQSMDNQYPIEVLDGYTDTEHHGKSR